MNWSTRTFFPARFFIIASQIQRKYLGLCPCRPVATIPKHDHSGLRAPTNLIRCSRFRFAPPGATRSTHGVQLPGGAEQAQLRRKGPSV